MQRLLYRLCSWVLIFQRGFDSIVCYLSFSLMFPFIKQQQKLRLHDLIVFFFFIVVRDPFSQGADKVFL